MGVFKHIIITDWAQVYVNSFVVDPKTIGQYTGLLDKNAEKIYEGDIVKVYIHNGLYQDELIEKVIYKKGQFGIRHGDLYKCFYPLSAFHKKIKTEYISNFGEIAVETEPLFEIIGNVHDNPEQLGGDTE